jgi:hypothetical protein
MSGFDPRFKKWRNARFGAGFPAFFGCRHHSTQPPGEDAAMVGTSRVLLCPGKDLKK